MEKKSQTFKSFEFMEIPFQTICVFEPNRVSTFQDRTGMLTSVTLTQYCYLRDKLHVLYVFFRLLYFPLCIPKTCQSDESDTLNYPRGMKKVVCLTLSGIICIINRQPDKWISSIHLQGKAKSLRSQLCGKRKDAHNPMSCSQQAL